MPLPGTAKALDKIFGTSLSRYPYFPIQLILPSLVRISYIALVYIGTRRQLCLYFHLFHFKDSPFLSPDLPCVFWFVAHLVSHISHKLIV